MSYVERIKAIAKRAPTQIAVLDTEEATKNALVMPFIAALGYDVFDPLEVVPEFTADVGLKKGEKVDYAIRVEDEIVLLFECKRAGQTLDPGRDMGQLFRYFSVTNARIGVLTNGVHYQFYSDIEAPNKMDAKPFLEMDILDLKDQHLRELERITKQSFDLENMLSAASDLKYMKEIRRYLEAQLEEPDEEFVRLCFSQAVPEGRFTKNAKAQFSGLVHRVVTQLISDRVNERLRSALAREEGTGESEAPVAAASEAGSDVEDGEQRDGVETTEEELEGYRVVKAIVCAVLPAERIFHRDTKSYFGVLADDNNRKPICRLHFNRSQKYIGLFDAEKNETREAIETVEDIYRFAAQLRDAASRYADPGAD